MRGLAGKSDYQVDGVLLKSKRAGIWEVVGKQVTCPTLVPPSAPSWCMVYILA